MAGGLQKPPNQVPVLRGKNARVGVWTIDPQGLPADARATFEFDDIKSHEYVAVMIHPRRCGLYLKVVNVRLKNTWGLREGRTKIDVHIRDCAF